MSSISTTDVRESRHSPLIDAETSRCAPGRSLSGCSRAEEFERHEALTLQRTLDRMADLVYCPRCSQPVIEDSTHCAQCTRCRSRTALCSVAFERCRPHA